MNTEIIIWILIAIALGVVESLTSSLVSIWGAVAAIICAFIAAFGVSYKIIVLIFVLITLVLLWVTRPLAKKILNDKVVATNADRIIGSEGQVIKKISANASGQVDIRGQIWTAYEKNASEVEVGEKVRIISIEGVKAIVERI